MILNPPLFIKDSCVADTPSISIISTLDSTADPLVINEGTAVRIACRVNSVYPTSDVMFSLKSASTTVKAPKSASGSSSVSAIFNDVEIRREYDQRLDARLYCEVHYSAPDSIPYEQTYQYLDVTVPRECSVYILFII